jgi:hypothetical protein
MHGYQMQVQKNAGITEFAALLQTAGSINALVASEMVSWPTIDRSIRSGGPVKSQEGLFFSVSSIPFGYATKPFSTLSNGMVDMLSCPDLFSDKWNAQCLTNVMMRLGPKLRHAISFHTRGW